MVSRYDCQVAQSKKSFEHGTKLSLVSPGALGALSVLFIFAKVVLGSDLRDAANRADYVIIAPTSYLEIAERLATFRHERSRFATMVVNVDSAITQFGAGVSADTALKNFIQYAIDNWREPRPQFFVFAGNINTIPSHPVRETITGCENSSIDTVLMMDQWFAQIPDGQGGLVVNTCVGRLPAWDSTDLSVMVDKTIRYETEAAGTWCNRAISLADYCEEDGNIFECDATSFLGFLDSIWADTICIDVRSESPAHLSPADFVERWNDGAAIVTYCGHSDPTVFSDSKYFTTSTVDSLTNGEELPVCFFGGCDLNFDNSTEESIPTHLLDHTGGGAVAVVSSEGIMYEGVAFSFFTTMIHSIVGNPDKPIGLAFEEAMPTMWGPDLYDRFTFLGDPALTIKYPGAGTAVVMKDLPPGSFDLQQNYPNPFNPSTTIIYQLSTTSDVSLKVFDVLGREVAALVSGRRRAGVHSVKFDGACFAGGVYFYRLEVSGVDPLKAEEYTKTMKFLLLK